MSEPGSGRRGRLKIFLGYAAGVGKTYRMLEEGQRLKQEGVDVVVGYFESHGRRDTISRAEGLEAVSRRAVEYRGINFSEMDTPAIIARNPAVCLVDEFAHTNIPGLERAKRWEDVMFLLDAGVDVYTTMNVQHLESLNDQVRQVTGIRVGETVPDWVIKQADEIVMVDATPEALINRLRRGVIYDSDKAQRALENFFKESTLAALRELAMRQTAHEVELRIDGSADASLGKPAEDSSTAPPEPGEAEARERILIYVTADPMAAVLIRRGKRVADHLRADCFAAYVCRHSDLSDLPSPERQGVEKHLNFARNLHIETRILQGDDPSRTLVEFARQNRVTQIFLARARRSWWSDFLHRDLVSKLVHRAYDMRVILVAERGHPAE